MATVNVNLTCDLQHPVQVQYIGGNMFSQDNAGNTINVEVFNDGEPATLGGSISANVIRADGATVAVSGALSGNRAYVIFPQACYAVPGTITVIIKNTESSTVTTIAAFVANVYQSTTDTVVDPGQIIPSVSALIAQIEAAVDSIPVDYSGLLATIAADYSSSKTYPVVGMYAWQGGVLKRNIVPITTAETYTAAHWTNAVIGDDLSALKSAIDDVKTEAGSKTDITSLFTFTNGYRINSANAGSNLGKRQSESSSEASGYVNIEGYEYILLSMKYMKASQAGASGLAFYSSNSEASVISGSGKPNPYNPDLEEASAIMWKQKVPTGAKYIRTTWWGTSTDQYSEYSFVAYGIIEGELKEEIDAIDTRLATAEGTLETVENMSGTKEDISGLFSFTDGYRINFITGANQSNSSSSTSGFTDIEGFTHLLLTQRFVKASNATGMAFYSSASADDFISGIREPYDSDLAASTYKVSIVQIPTGAKYIRTTWWNSSESQYAETAFSCYGIVAKELQNEIDEINESIKQIIDAIDNIGGSEGLPDYYFDEKYLPGRVDDIVTKIRSASMKGDIFFWYTDPHYFAYSTPSIHNGLHGPQLINYIAERINIRKVFCGGDLTNGNGMTQATNLKNLQLVRQHLNPVWQNLCMIIGNHEWNNPNSQQSDKQLTMNIIYEMLIKDKENVIQGADELGDYYIDNPVQKIRYLFIGCEYNATIATARVTWVAEQLTEVPSGYTVVVLSHLALNTTGAIDSQFSPIASVLDAANAKSTITVNGTTYNYSTFAGEVACVLSGHNHRDLDNETTGGIPIISTTCDRGKDGNSSSDFNDAREYGTINEQAIDVVLIDTENREINMIRIGGSWDGTAALENPDRSFSY